MRRYQLPDYVIPINKEWRRIRNEEIECIRISDPKRYEFIDNYIYEYQINPLSFALPHGRPRQDKYSNDGVAFLNDWKNDFLIVFGPNQTGKSHTGATKTALYLIPTKPDWVCYKHHRIKYHKWRGPKIAVVASYSWENIGIVWEAYKKILPRHELGPYAPNWGAFEDETGSPKKISLAGNNPNKEIELACGSRIVFLNYGQGMEHWEGRQCDMAHLDEQCPENLFDALTARMRTRGGVTGFTPIWTTMTPHIVEGRPDTGAAGFICNKILPNKTNKGRSVKFYYLTVDSTPDAIYSKSQKKQAYQQYVAEPESLNDDRAIRHGRSRYYGEPEVGGGLVIANFNPTIHVVDNYDITKLKPTYYRMIDHGLNPCAALIIAVLPDGTWVVDREYYDFGKTIGSNAKSIVETLSGNSIHKSDEYEDENGRRYPIYDEVSKSIEFYASELDCRSFGTKSVESNRTIGVLYNEYGCRCTPASGTHREITLPLLLDMFSLDKNRKHLSERYETMINPDIHRFGSPKIYIKAQCRNLISEIQNWVYNEKNKPVDGGDHAISCLLFGISRERPYMGDYTDTCRQEDRLSREEGASYKPRSNTTGI